MRCIEVMELMQRNLDGDLTPDEYKQLENHLVTCSECRGLNDGLTKLSYELELLPEVEPPFSLVDTILPQLSSQSNAATIPLNQPRKIPQKMYWTVGTSAAAVLVIALYGSFGSSKIPTDEAKENPVASAPQRGDAEIKKTADVPSVDSHPEKNVTSTAMDQPHSTEANQLSKDQASRPEEPAKNKTLLPSTKPKPDMSKNEAVKENGSKEQVPAAKENAGPIASEEKNQAQVIAPKEGAITALKQPEQANSSSEGPKTNASAVQQPATVPMALAPAAKQNSGESSAGHMGFAASGMAPNQAAKANETKSTSSDYPSPDGKWTASIMDQSIVVRNSSGSVVFSSHRFGQVQKTNVYWLDNQLIYELYRSDSIERWKINLQIGQEQKE
jgi:hypothetical protein